MNNLRLLDQYGGPLEDAAIPNGGVQPGYLGSTSGLPVGWSYTDDTQVQVLSLDRTTLQRGCYIAWLLNPLLYGALEVIKGFTVGDGLSYAKLDDKKAQIALEEFWAANDLDQLSVRWHTEYMLMGECLTLFPPNMAGVNRPARVGLYRVMDGGFTLYREAGMPDRVERIDIGIGKSRRTLEPGDFIWSAEGAILNEVRGMPPVARALGAALAYVDFINSRIGVHKLASRINAVYYAFANDANDLKVKAARYRNLPKNGSILTLAMNPQGVSEKFEIVAADAKAVDSAADGRAIRQLLAVALGLPEHYLSEGSGTNKSTADSMGKPARVGFQNKQAQVRRWLTKLFRLELKRRYGPDQLYSVLETEMVAGVKKTRKKRVTADLLEPNLIFPTLDDEDLQGLVEKVKAAAELRLASRQTLSGQMGYDPALEFEIMASEDTQNASVSPPISPSPPP